MSHIDHNHKIFLTFIFPLRSIFLIFFQYKLIVWKSMAFLRSTKQACQVNFWFISSSTNSIVYANSWSLGLFARIPKLACSWYVITSKQFNHMFQLLFFENTLQTLRKFLVPKSSVFLVFFPRRSTILSSSTTFEKSVPIQDRWRDQQNTVTKQVNDIFKPHCLDYTVMHKTFHSALWKNAYHSFVFLKTLLSLQFEQLFWKRFLAKSRSKTLLTHLFIGPKVLRDFENEWLFNFSFGILKFSPKTETMFRKDDCQTWLSIGYPPIGFLRFNSASTQLLVETRMLDKWGFTEFFFCYPDFSCKTKIIGFEKVFVSTGFP